jgi:hypothetical protein
MAQRIGTSHFVSLRRAAAYYAAYGYTSEDVKEKIAKGEISIGRPEGRNVTADRDGRYWRDF